MAPLIFDSGLTTEWITSRPSSVTSPVPNALPPAALIWYFAGLGTRRQNMLSPRPPYMPMTADSKWLCGNVIWCGPQSTSMIVRTGARCSTLMPALSGSPRRRRKDAGSDTARATTSFMAWRDCWGSVARRSAINWSRSNKVASPSLAAEMHSTSGSHECRAAGYHPGPEHDAEGPKPRRDTEPCARANQAYFGLRTEDDRAKRRRAEPASGPDTSPAIPCRAPACIVRVAGGEIGWIDCRRWNLRGTGARDGQQLRTRQTVIRRHLRRPD